MVAASSGEWVSTIGAAEVASKRERASSFAVRVHNPLERAATFRLEFPATKGWSFSVDRPERRIASGDSEEFRVLAGAPAFTGSEAEVEYQVTLEFELASGLRQPLHVRRAIPLAIDQDSGRTRSARNRVLLLDGSSSVRVPSFPEAGPWKQFTLECWARGAQPADWKGLVSNTQSSGFCLNWGAEGPKGSIRLQELSNYLAVTSKKKPEPERWMHLAFVWDGQVARIFANGKLQDEVPAQGVLRGNKLPLFIGADTDRRGNPEHSFTGAIDEVRVSRVARYARSFKPKKRFEPDSDTVLLMHFDDTLEGVFPDESGEHHHGFARGAPQLVEEKR